MSKGLLQWQKDFLERHSLPRRYLAQTQKWCAPLSGSLAKHQTRASRTLIVAINGCQGSGKTTVCDYLRLELEATYGLSVLVLSLDDFYLPREQRLSLARSVHPLLATRGVPGTHDMALLNRCLDALLDPLSTATVAIPRFDKATDNRCPITTWRHINPKPDLILLEGWCIGARPQSVAQVTKPVNALERDEDQEARWRTYVNDSLAKDFEPLYRRFDKWVMLRAPSFSSVYRWRLEQEQKLVASVVPDELDRRMDAAQVAHFIQYYERLTTHCLENLPKRVQYLYILNEQRQITTSTTAIADYD